MTETKGHARPTASEQITERICGLTDWRGPLLARLRALILDAAPDLTEACLSTTSRSSSSRKSNTIPFRAASSRTASIILRKASRQVSARRSGLPSYPKKVPEKPLISRMISPICRPVAAWVSAGRASFTCSKLSPTTLSMKKESESHRSWAGSEKEISGTGMAGFCRTRRMAQTSVDMMFRSYCMTSAPGDGATLRTTSRPSASRTR